MELSELILKHIENSLELKKAIKKSLELALIREDYDNCEKYAKELVAMNNSIVNLMTAMDIELDLDEDGK